MKGLAKHRQMRDAFIALAKTADRRNPVVKRIKGALGWTTKRSTKK